MAFTESRCNLLLSFIDSDPNEPKVAVVAALRIRDAWLRRFMALDPSAVSVALLGGVLVGSFLLSLLRNTLPDIVLPLVGVLLPMALFCGYPLLVGTAVERVVHRSPSRTGVAALLAYLWALAAWGFTSTPSLHPNSVAGLLMIMCVVPSVLAPPYILWFGAHRLASAELRRPVRFDDYIGALLLFGFFLIGSFYLQQRLNGLVSSLEADE